MFYGKTCSMVRHVHGKTCSMVRHVHGKAYSMVLVQTTQPMYMGIF